MTEVRTCAVDAAPIRAVPDDGAEQVTQALRGEPLTVEEERDGWARVRTAYEYPGWIRHDALGPVPGTVPRTWLPEPRPEDLRRGDLVTYCEGDATTHIAFWLGDGRILHSTEREDAKGVVEETEPEDLHRKRRRFVRLD